MSVKDLFFVTGSDTTVEIYDSDTLLWYGNVDEIDFVYNVPCGDYEVSNISVVGNVLQIHI